MSGSQFLSRAADGASASPALDDRYAAVVQAFAQVDKYQPPYRLEHELAEFSERVFSRLCVDRCEALANLFGDDIAQIRILDVGCSMGYISLYMSDRGSDVTGIDSNLHNIEFANALAEYHGIVHNFQVAEFDAEFCNTIEEGQYDYVFLFSILHHIVHKHGIEYTRSLIVNLLYKVDALFIELARKEEDVIFDWRASLPDEHLALFNGISDLRIEAVGEFRALNGGVLRPMYRASLTKKVFSSIPHTDLKIKRSRIEGGFRKERKYYLTSDVFTKSFVFERQNPDVHKQFLSEVDAYRRIGSHRNFCPFLGSEIRGRLGFISLARIEGDTLMDAIVNHVPLDLGRVAHDALQVLAALCRAGLYWNDLRSHNFIVQRDRLVAIDFEFAEPVEREHTLNLFLWLLYDLQMGRSKTHESGIFSNNNLAVPRPPIEAADFDSAFKDLPMLGFRCRDIREFVSIACST